MNKSITKEPLVRIAKREGLALWKRLGIRLLGLLLSLVLCGVVIIALTGLNPLEVFKAMWEGAFGTAKRSWVTARDTATLLCVAIGLAPAFAMRFWNIGAEGQITMGGFGATLVALNLSPDTPAFFSLLLMMIAAIICGGIWAFIPAFFKAKWGINETIFTLMMNYVAIKFVTYLCAGPWKDPSFNGFPRVSAFKENFILQSVGGVNIGWIFAIILTAFVFFLLKYTKIGYEISVIGESVDTARYAGMNIGKVIIISMLISGGLCGLTGMIQASAVEKTLVATVANGYGFTAIITAWLSKLNPIICVAVCLAFAVLVQGGDYIQIALGVSSSVSSVVQGLVLFFVLGSEFFLRYKIVFGNKEEA